MTPLEEAEVNEKFYRRLDEIVSDSIRHRSGDPAAPDVVARNLRMAREDIARREGGPAAEGDEDGGEEEEE
jgi:hypothetical protein